MGGAPDNHALADHLPHLSQAAAILPHMHGICTDFGSHSGVIIQHKDSPALPADALHGHSPGFHLRRFHSFGAELDDSHAAVNEGMCARFHLVRLSVAHVYNSVQTASREKFFHGRTLPQSPRHYKQKDI